MNIKFRQLQGFVAAAKAGSFTGAARQMAITQPAFSQLIRELESTLRVKLFDRTTRRMELTEAGHRFLAMVERPFDDLHEAYKHVTEMASGTRGRMAFASLHSVAFGFVIQALARFKLRYPAINVRLIESNNSDLVERVLNREVDFGIGTLPVPRRELTFRKLLEDEVLLVYPASHPFAKQRNVGWRDVASEPVVLMPKGSSARELAERGFAASHITRDPDYEVVNMVTALSMVRARLAITFMSALAFKQLNTKGLRTSRMREPRPIRSIGIIARVDRPLSGVAQTYVDLLVSATQQGASVKRS
jgi:DNA-binding transcriptional LysR family regulator